MDRPEPYTGARHSPTVEPVFEVESGLFSTSRDETISSIFAPLHYEPGYAYPLIVWLHGRHGDERQLTRVMPLVSMRNYIAVAPRGGLVGEADKSGRPVYGWEQSEAAIQRAEQHVFDSIETASRKFHVDKHRIFLAGFDCGGTMAFRVAINHPSRFAGVLSLCGPFPGGHNPFSNLIDVRRLPVFLAVGRDSQEYPAEQFCENLRLFHSAGLSVTLRQYPCGHELSPQMLADVDRWTIEQMTPDEPSFSEPDHEWLPGED